MKKLFLILPVVLLLAAGCGSQTTQYSPSPAPSAAQNPVSQTPAPAQTPEPPAQPQGFNLVKLAINGQNNTSELGSASIFDVNGKAKVIVTLAGAPPKAVQPAHIHFGSCAKLGDVRYPLTNVGNGVFVTVLPVSLAELVAQPFAINAHKSATEIGTYVACGDSTKMVKSVSTDPSLGAK